MKKLFTIFSSYLLTPIGSTLTVACDPIVSIPSKSFKGTIDQINVFFKDKETIKPYNLKYLFFINDSWEHFGFESSLSSNKIDKTSIGTDDNEFVNIVSDIYKSRTKNDFTGMTIIVENIFVNSIEVNADNNYETFVQSELALTIKKGWKEQGKILASIINETALNKEHVFLFVNKIINGIDFGLQVSEQKNDQDIYEITGSINQKEKFMSKLISSSQSKLNLDLTGKISFEENDIMIIDGVKYKFI